MPFAPQPTAALLAGALLAAAAYPQALQQVRLHDDGRAHRPPPPAEASRISRAWPFCPSDRIPCDEDELAWVELTVSLDVYSARRNDPHDSIANLLALTRTDFAPLVGALEAFFERRRLRSDVARVAFVHGLVQGVVYEGDATTGWTEYPKSGLELLVDEQGDCDDAAIAAGVLLDELGYETYFVRWRGSDAGHLSTAVDPSRGDLAEYPLPPGSRWIPGPGGRRLLHVDATGSAAGCGRARVDCDRLGTNRWHEDGLRVAGVARVDDPRLSLKLPLAAWSNGGFRRPQRVLVDRRMATERAIRSELAGRDDGERLRRRLSSLGIDEEQARRYLARRRLSRGTVYGVVALALAVSILLVAWQARARLERRRRVARARARRRRAAF